MLTCSMQQVVFVLQVVHTNLQSMQKKGTQGLEQRFRVLLRLLG